MLDYQVEKLLNSTGLHSVEFLNAPRKDPLITNRHEYCRLDLSFSEINIISKVMTIFPTKEDPILFFDSARHIARV